MSKLDWRAKTVVFVLILGTVFFGVGRFVASIGSESGVIAEAEAKIPTAVAARYERRGAVRCVQYCKKLAGSIFEYPAYDHIEGALVTLRLICDDVSDERQCSYMVRR